MFPRLIWLVGDIANDFRRDANPHPGKMFAEEDNIVINLNIDIITMSRGVLYYLVLRQDPVYRNILNKYFSRCGLSEWKKVDEEDL